MSKIKIGAQVTAKVYPTKVTVSGTFQGYELQDQEDPTSVCGKVFYVKDGMQRLDFVYVDSIKGDSESEDEWIRKHIIKILDNLAPCHWDGNEKARCIAYLERQKEGNLVDKKYVQEAFNKGMQAGMMQKPAEWSEEDERNINTLISVIKAHYNEYDLVRDDYPINARELGDWLKSLRPQPKAELTLLDENIIDAAVAFVEQNNHFNFWRGIDKHTVIKALRSLKPHWKPSKEQMEALKLIVSNKKHYAPVLHEIALDTLYNDLKKL